MIYAVVYLFITVCCLYYKIRQLERKTDLLLQILQEHHEELYENTRSPFSLVPPHDQQLPLN